MGDQAALAIKRIGERLAEVNKQPLTVVMGWLRCRISFALLRSTLVCLRGSRPFRPKKDKDEDVIELAVSEARIWQ